jgi:type IV pilus assembly protein PilM
VGIDIGHAELTLVELTRLPDGKLEINSEGCLEVPRGLFVDGHIERLDVAGEWLRRAVQQLGVRSRRLAMALSSRDVFCRRLKVPTGLSRDDQERHIGHQASGFSGVPVDELMWDFVRIDPIGASSQDLDVLVAAARKDRVLDRMALAESAGLELAVLDIEPNATRLAVQHWMSRVGGGPALEPCALLDWRGPTLHLEVYVGPEVVFERRQMCVPPQTPESILGIVDRLLQQFHARSPTVRLPGLVLAGRLSHLVSFDALLADATGLPASLFDPCEGIKPSPKRRAPAAQTTHAAGALAFGLALRGLQS